MKTRGALGLLLLWHGVSLVAAGWRYDTGGQVRFSPAIGNGTVFVISDDSNLHAVNAATGAVRWRYTAGGKNLYAPTVSRGHATVFVGSANDYLHAVDAATGSLRWRYATNDLVYPAPALSGDDATVFAGSFDNHLYAIETATGALRWRYRTDGDLRTSPAVSGDDATVFFGSSDGHLYAVDAAVGALRWRYKTGSFSLSSPAVSRDDSLVFVGCNDNYVHAVDVATGALRWRSLTGSDVFSSPAVSKDGATVFMGSDDYYLYAFEVATGTIRWRYRTGGAVDTSPAVSRDDTTIFVSSQDRYLYAVDAATGALQWRVHTGGEVVATGVPLMSPVVSEDGGTIFAGGNDRYLLAISLCAAAPTGTPACAPATCAAGHGAPPYYIDATDTAVCVPCGRGTFSAAVVAGANASCTPCPAGEFTPAAGQAACLACGYPEWCTGGSSCAAHRKGPGCAECTSGYVPLQGQCVKCPKDSWTTLLPVLPLLLLGFVVLRYLRRAVDQAVKRQMQQQLGQRVQRTQAVATGGRDMLTQVASLMTVLSSVQVACAVVSVNFAWPPLVARINAWLTRIASLDIVDAVTPECFAGVYDITGMKLFVRMLLPMLPVVVLGATNAALWPVQCATSLYCQRLAALRARLSSAALGFFLVCFVMAANVAFSAFDCIGGGNGYMRTLPSVECTMQRVSLAVYDTETTLNDDGTLKDAYGTLLPASIVTLVLLALSFAVLALVLYRGRHRLRTDEDFMRTYGTVYLRYENRCYYWEMVVLARKFFVVFAARALARYPAIQVTCFVVLLGASLGLQVAYKPMLSDDLDNIEQTVLSGCLAIALLGAWSQFGAAGEGSNVAVTVLYFAVLLITAMAAAPALRRIWRGNDGDDDDGTADESTEGTKDTSAVVPTAKTIVGPRKKVVV